MKSHEGLLPCPNEPEAFAFNVGDPVSKPSGYAFDGIVRSAFHNEGGVARYVVEHAAIKGMLHIFSRKQLAARTPSPSGAREILAQWTPTEAQWGGLARSIMMWLDMDPKTPRALFRHLEATGTEIPQWLRDEPEMKALDHVPSKGTRCVIIYRAMLATISEGT